MTIYTYEDQKQAHCDIQRLTFKQFNCRSTLKTYCALVQFVTTSQIFTIDSMSGMEGKVKFLRRGRRTPSWVGPRRGKLRGHFPRRSRVYAFMQLPSCPARLAFRSAWGYSWACSTEERLITNCPSAWTPDRGLCRSMIMFRIRAPKTSPCTLPSWSHALRIGCR